MFRSQLKKEMTVLGARLEHWKLRDESVLVFDFHLEVIALKKRRRQIQHSCQFSRSKAVIHIICHPGLEGTRRDLAHRASAIDEPFVHPARLCDVCMRRNPPAIGKNERQLVAGMFLQMIFEFAQFHKFNAVRTCVHCNIPVRAQHSMRVSRAMRRPMGPGGKSKGTRNVR